MQAATIGMRKRMAVSTRACGICSGELRDFGAVVSASEEAQAGQNGQAKLWGAESTVQLECKHCFHDQCIRGWTIVGKKVSRLLRPLFQKMLHPLPCVQAQTKTFSEKSFLKFSPRQQLVRL